MFQVINLFPLLPSPRPPFLDLPSPLLLLQPFLLIISIFFFTFNGILFIFQSVSLCISDGSTLKTCVCSCLEGEINLAFERAMFSQSTSPPSACNMLIKLDHTHTQAHAHTSLSFIHKIKHWIFTTDITHIKNKTNIHPGWRWKTFNCLRQVLIASADAGYTVHKWMKIWLLLYKKTKMRTLFHENTDRKLSLVCAL